MFGALQLSGTYRCIAKPRTDPVLSTTIAGALGDWGNE